MSSEKPLDADQSLIESELKLDGPLPRPSLDEDLISRLLISAAGALPYVSGQGVLRLVLRAIIDAHPVVSVSAQARLGRAEKALMARALAGGRPENEIENTMLVMAEAWVADRSFDRTNSQIVTGKSLRRRPLGRKSIDTFAEIAIDQLYPDASPERRAKLIGEATAAFSKDRNSWIAQLELRAERVDAEALIARSIVEILAASGCPVDTRGLVRPKLTDWSKFDAGDAYSAWIERSHDS